MPNRYFIDGAEVSREQAVAHWHSSRTYENAARRHRGYLFLLADRGVNTDGEINHLAEAGIRIEHGDSATHGGDG